MTRFGVVSLYIDWWNNYKKISLVSLTCNKFHKSIAI